MTKTHRPPRMLLLSWLGLLALLGKHGGDLVSAIGRRQHYHCYAHCSDQGRAGCRSLYGAASAQSANVDLCSCGFFWLGIMLWLTLADYVTRPNFPPAAHWGSSFTLRMNHLKWLRPADVGCGSTRGWLQSPPRTCALHANVCAGRIAHQASKRWFGRTMHLAYRSKGFNEYYLVA